MPEAEVHRRLSSQYGDNILPQQSLYEWIEKFKNGQTRVKHAERAGNTSATVNNIEQVDAMIRTNQ